MLTKAAVAAFRLYSNEIEAALQRGNATEHTHRSSLKTLVETLFPGLIATNEPKRAAFGAPDYVISQGATPVGYIEAKDVGDTLDKTEKTPQLKRYREGLGNLVLTDYLEFRWFEANEPKGTARLARPGPGGKLIVEPGGDQAVFDLLERFMGATTPTIRSPRELAGRMAKLAQLIRDATAQVLKTEGLSGSLHDQFDSFRQVLLPGLTSDQFADMYAQTICYGLFAARFNHKGAQPFDRSTAARDLPRTNPFLQKTFYSITGPDLDERIDWAVDEVANLLNRVDIAAILKDFGRRTRQEDPVVHFYETFLAEYDPKMREARGVYYTPQPVVSYIVRSVDHLLKTAFGLPDGLADRSKISRKTPDGQTTFETHRVQILDPATGTGTFLSSVISNIYEQTYRDEPALWSSYVSQHLLPRLAGFELLMAPYAVAHMKLGLQLAETGYNFQSQERVRIYLTNALEEGFESGKSLWAGWLKDEAEAASGVKYDAPVMVVLGNPPYSYESKNNGKWINDLVQEYYKVDGQPLGERNPKGLQDDYVKFIRFAQWRIQRTGHGILAFISNHGYLDNPTFRGMRQSLMGTFDDIYLLDLHGNSKKKERSPDGSPDQNVFDIQQGVAIGLFVKRPDSKGSKKPATVHHAHLYGQRETFAKNSSGHNELTGGKYHWLADNEMSSTDWQTIAPQSPFYLFTPQNIDLLGEYQSGWKVTDILPVNNAGIVTSRDELTIRWNKDEVWRTIEDFSKLAVEEARTKYTLGPDTRDWQVILAQQNLRVSGLSKNKIVPILYRPFDLRYTYYTGNSRGFQSMPRNEVMHNMLDGTNIGLITVRQVAEGIFTHVLVSNSIVDNRITLSNKGYGILFPLYLYPDTSKKTLFDVEEVGSGTGGRRANLSAAFVEAVTEKTGLTWVGDGTGDLTTTVGPEDVFQYMYAVFHSPEYRRRYAEFLKIDFPRLPLTGNLELFRQLAGLGRELVGLHLLEGVSLPTRAIKFKGQLDNRVETVRYIEPKGGDQGAGVGDQPGQVWINPRQYFEGIAPAVWEFQVGGYQVLQKWLKDRKGRELSLDDIEHYKQIVVALSQTRDRMAEIDRAIEEANGWPL